MFPRIVRTGQRSLRNQNGIVLALVLVNTVVFMLMAAMAIKTTYGTSGNVKLIGKDRWVAKAIGKSAAIHADGLVSTGTDIAAWSPGSLANPGDALQYYLNTTDFTTSATETDSMNAVITIGPEDGNGQRLITAEALM